jgi:hypothetical protein
VPRNKLTFKNKREVEAHQIVRSSRNKACLTLWALVLVPELINAKQSFDTQSSQGRYMSAAAANQQAEDRLTFFQLRIP